MKRIEAIVKPFRAEEIRTALREAGIEAMTWFEGKGFGKQKGHTDLYRGAEYVVDYLPIVCVVLYVRDEQVDIVIETILNAAHTGRSGDGIIAIYDVHLVKIRTGETGNEAI